MKLTLHRRGAETAERDAECQPSLRWSQRSLRLIGIRADGSIKGRVVVVAAFLSFFGTFFLSFVEAVEMWKTVGWEDGWLTLVRLVR